MNIMLYSRDTLFGDDKFTTISIYGFFLNRFSPNNHLNILRKQWSKPYMSLGYEWIDFSSIRF